jgi:hypothetical protein
MLPWYGRKGKIRINVLSKRLNENLKKIAMVQEGKRVMKSKED